MSTTRCSIPLVTGGRVVVVGGGPCGLACARELLELGHRDVRVLESAPGPGGLASSIVDPAGFTWDRGGHVVFSHYGEFDRLLADVMGDDVEHHERSSYVHVGGAWVPYPHAEQPAPAAARHGRGCTDRPDRRTAWRPRARHRRAELDFGTWMLATFGDGIVEQFMRPYNEKVWAQPASAMSSRWIAERVSTVDWQQALRSVITRIDDVTWGPNNLFAFPSHGGTGEIYRRAAATDRSDIRYGTEVVSIDPDRRVVSLVDVRRSATSTSSGPARSIAWSNALRLPRTTSALPRTTWCTTASPWSASATRRRSATSAHGCTSRTRTSPSTGRRTSPSTPPATCPMVASIATAAG